MNNSKILKIAKEFKEELLADDTKSWWHCYDVIILLYETILKNLLED